MRAKFKVQSITPQGDGVSVKFAPVTSGSAENERFFKFTPWGSIEIGTVNPAAVAGLSEGQEVYVDFTPVEA